MPPVTGFTPKQARFVQEYLVDGNGTRAAVAAGYGVAGARVTACRLLTKPNVQKALEARQNADATRLSISREDVIAGLLRGIEGAQAKGDPMGVIRGWAEIGKMLGYFTVKKIQVEMTSGQHLSQTELAAMSDEALLALIEQGTAAA